ncbi:hypothetical protein [Pseudomonas sp. RIT-PI-o]|uniref:hypothetical protein n=1 Tax=Pseudomonas sp. RIT-PI-o TaxID=1690246 RepID=UPI00128F02ED|nr:hypothetical protein [Pseudomonas sp. RIT-PI-o]
MKDDADHPDLRSRQFPVQEDMAYQLELDIGGEMLDSFSIETMQPAPVRMRSACGRNFFERSKGVAAQCLPVIGGSRNERGSELFFHRRGGDHSAG